MGRQFYAGPFGFSPECEFFFSACLCLVSTASLGLGLLGLGLGLAALRLVLGSPLCGYPPSGATDCRTVISTSQLETYLELAVFVPSPDASSLLYRL